MAPAQDRTEQRSRSPSRLPSRRMSRHPLLTGIHIVGSSSFSCRSHRRHGGWGRGRTQARQSCADRRRLTLALTAGMLIGVASTQAARLKPPSPELEAPNQAEGPALEAQTAPSAIEAIRAKAIARLHVLRAAGTQKAKQIDFIRLGTALAGIPCMWYVSRLDLYAAIPTPAWVWIVHCTRGFQRSSVRDRPPDRS